MGASQDAGWGSALGGLGGGAGKAPTYFSEWFVPTVVCVSCIRGSACRVFVCSSCRDTEIEGPSHLGPGGCGRVHSVFCLCPGRLLVVGELRISLVCRAFTPSVSATCSRGGSLGVCAQDPLLKNGSHPATS